MHLVDIALLAVLALACFFVLRGMARRRRQGRSCCGDCASCGKDCGQQPPRRQSH